MAGVGWFRRLQVAGNATVSSDCSVSGILSISTGGVDLGLSTSPTTGTDLAIGGNHILVTTSDNGYYLLDPPATVGRTLVFVRQGTTATTSFVVPDTTTVHIYTSSGSTGGRVGTFSGGAGCELLAVTTAAWLPIRKWGNANFTSST